MEFQSNKCKKELYTTNTVISHCPLMCFGGFGQPRCQYLMQCVEENKRYFTNKRYNKIKTLIYGNSNIQNSQS